MAMFLFGYFFCGFLFLMLFYFSPASRRAFAKARQDIESLKKTYPNVNEENAFRFMICLAAIIFLICWLPLFVVLLIQMVMNFILKNK